MPIIRFLLILLSVLSSAGAWSASGYAPYIDDIQSRLDKTAALYQNQQANDARREVQMAYFEVFENLEGPIRINISAQKSYQMEAAFGDIRRMIGEGKPQPEVQAKIDWLKSELSGVEAVLDGGHQLVAEQQHGAYDNQAIALYWQQSFKTIDDLLAQAISQYQAGDRAAAAKSIQQAHFQGFKNSEMEMSIRQNRASQTAAGINQQFTALIALSNQPDQLSELGYRTTELLQTLEDILPGLPTTRADQAVAAPGPAGQPAADTDANTSADWGAVAASINQSVQAAIQQYRAGQEQDAILAIQDAYFDHFEASGMENKIGSRDAAFKTTLEGHFTRLVSLMKSGQAAAQINAEADALQQDLAQAVALIGQSGESPWSLLVYSLLIIVREGMEALLIVAAIVAYLIKNQQHDKLPMIRQSVWAALACSVVTALLFQWLFTNSGASRELLEGITMLIAVVMLFFMSYWLLSKVEARHWKAYLEGKLSHALTSGSLLGLWLTSFLAVYREGAETVLFYYALLGDAQTVTGHAAVLAGFVLGCIILLLAWFIMRYTVLKLPLKPFFMFTGSFMYLMAFIFAGKGILELVEGKLFQPTLLPGWPEIGWLGVYPYIETLLPQAVLVLAALVALWIMRRRNTALPPM